MISPMDYEPPYEPATCPHKFHWANIDMVCELEEGHGAEHKGTYECSKVTWWDGDRRDYLGKLTKCLDKACILPGSHSGDHAY